MLNQAFNCSPLNGISNISIFLRVEFRYHKQRCTKIDQGFTDVINSSTNEFCKLFGNKIPLLYYV